MNNEIINVIVKVRGGTVTSVEVTGPDTPVEVKILDYDDRDAGEADVEEGKRHKDHWIYTIKYPTSKEKQ